MTHRLAQRDYLVNSGEFRLYPVSFYLPSQVDQLTDASTSAPTFVTVTGAGSANAKGSYSELVASTSADASLLTVYINGTSTLSTNTATLLDIATGAAASETVVVADIPIGYLEGIHVFQFPITIPAGTRVSARLQSAVTSKTASVAVALGRLSNRVQPASYCTTYGTTSATSLGTSVAYPGSLNTETSWVQVTASTTERLGGIVVGLQGNADTTMGSGTILVDVAVGAAASESSVISDVYIQTNSNEFIRFPSSPFIYPVDIPLGTRLSARAMFGASANNNGVDVTLIGIPWRI